MDPVRNPYSPGAGTPPPHLAGRADLQEAFSTSIARAQIGIPVQPLVLSGRRGVGKTVLLLRWRSLATEAGWSTAHIEARSDADLRQQLGDAITDIVRQVSRRFRNQDRVERLGRVAASFLRAAGAAVGRGGLTLGVEPERGVADSGILETDLGEILVELGHAARQVGTGAVLLIDELQDAGTTELSGLVGVCHRVNQAGVPALIVGAGLPTGGGPTRWGGAGPGHHRAGRQTWCQLCSGRGRCATSRAATRSSSRPMPSSSGTWPSRAR
ncbi:MAG: ATP-binding protein [Acidimicrobiales bacterium]